MWYGDRAHVFDILPLTLQDPQAWLATGQTFDFKLPPANECLSTCHFIETSLAPYFANITVAQVAADENQSVKKALKLATQVVDFGTQCFSKSLECGIVPHGTAACKLWCTMLSHRTADVQDLKEVVDWYDAQKRDPKGVVPSVHESVIAQMLESSTNSEAILNLVVRQIDECECFNCIDPLVQTVEET